MEGQAGRRERRSGAAGLAPPFGYSLTGPGLIFPSAQN